MKAFQRILIALIVLGLLGAYFLWPYFEIRRFATAVNKNDRETVKAMLDPEEMRTSLKKIIVDGLVLVGTEQAAGRADSATIRQKVDEFTESTEGKAMLEQAMSADALALMLTSHVKDGKKVPMTWRNEQWTGPLNFRVQDPESSAYLHMKLKGTGWKVTGIEVQESDLKEFVSKQRQLGSALPQ